LKEFTWAYDPAIEISALTKSFGKAKALDSLDLTPGEHPPDRVHGPAQHFAEPGGSCVQVLDPVWASIWARSVSEQE
jgi:hypothetical protein